MPTKKKTSPARRKPVRRTSKASFSAMASTRLKQLRKTLDQLKARLEKEARRAWPLRPLLARRRRLAKPLRYK
jgi:hypothetical protein